MTDPALEPTKSKTETWTAKLQALAAKVPGLTEFQNRDKLREQDKALRDHTVKKIEEVKTGVAAIKNALLDRMLLGPLPAFDRLSQQLDRLRDKHRYAARGYSGAFDPNQILDPELQKLYETDLAILEHTDALAKSCAAASGGEITEASANAALASLKTEIGALAQLIDNRDETVRKIGL